MPRFAANLTMMFQEHDFLDRFEAAAAAGFRGVEYLFPYVHPAAKIRQLLSTTGLEQVLFNLPPGNFKAGDRGIAAAPGRENEFRRSVDTAAQYVEVIGTPSLHVMAGIPGPGVLYERAHDTYLENLAYALGELAGSGVDLLIEPINHRDMPGYFLNTLAQAREVIRTLGHPRLKLQLDWYHAQITEGDLSVKTKRFLPYVGHIQAAGGPDRHEPDEGEVNYPHLYDLVDSLGYKGWIGCEYRPRGETRAGLTWLQTVKADSTISSRKL